MGILDTLKKRREQASKSKAAPVAVTQKSVEEKVKKEEKAAPSTSSGQAKKLTVYSSAHAVLLTPVSSEKSARAEANNTYTFRVSRNASKGAVKLAVKELYGVVPMRVRVISTQGKNVRFGRTQGRRSDAKKALVTLPKGQSIRIHEGV